MSKNLIDIVERRLKEAEKDYKRLLHSDADSRFVCGRVKALFDLMEELKSTYKNEMQNNQKS